MSDDQKEKRRRRKKQQEEDTSEGDDDDDDDDDDEEDDDAPDENTARRYAEFASKHPFLNVQARRLNKERRELLMDVVEYIDDVVDAYDDYDKKKSPEERGKGSRCFRAFCRPKRSSYDDIQKHDHHHHHHGHDHHEGDVDLHDHHHHEYGSSHNKGHNRAVELHDHSSDLGRKLSRTPSRTSHRRSSRTRSRRHKSRRRVRHAGVQCQKLRASSSSSSSDYEDYCTCPMCVKLRQSHFYPQPTGYYAAQPANDTNNLLLLLVKTFLENDKDKSDSEETVNYECGKKKSTRKELLKILCPCSEKKKRHIKETSSNGEVWDEDEDELLKSFIREIIDAP